ncbi:cytochrome P450 [Salinimicrobium xinjiangense]|uniref:cytochrome P450 n=1 Tax=Salinimicrobium xinjiangense TaxID=438596 RepID=UPI00040713D2|nr:cytochrome P450 [Salinimicrobium xinjiangense]
MESTPGIALKGYSYFHDQFVEKKTDILQTRLFLKKAIVMRGERAAEIFYDTSLFTRKDATPKRFQKTLLGEGGVQGLDEEEHAHRKHMFMQVMNEDSLDRLEQYFEEHLNHALLSWEKQEEITFYKEIEEVLFRASCDWVGVPVKEKEVQKHTEELSQMIDGSGGFGLRHHKGRKARKKAEKWIMKLVTEKRRKEKKSPGDSILSQFAFHRDLKGKLLKKRIVAVEILNLLRPIVAIARYITFAALALHEHPQYRERLRKDMEKLDLYFVQEVRRFYPFFPFVAAKVKEEFEWKNVVFPKGRRVLLDLYATQHHEDIWTNPNAFYAERFSTWDGSAFNFIPQGGGDYNQNHRCAGEWITINLTRIALDYLVSRMEYEVPEQDLKIDLSRIPAIPESRFKMQHIKRSLHGIQVK